MKYFKSLAAVAGCLLAAFSLNAAEKIVIKGSDTIGAKLAPQQAEQFKADMKAYGVDVTFEIEAEGSSTGVAAIIDSTADIGMASRGVKDKEYAKAKANGVDLRTVTIAKDGIAIIVNESNPMDAISLDQIEMIFTGDVADWSAVIAKSGEISAYTRNTSSGTYKVFQELGMNKRDYGAQTQKMAGNEQIAAEVAKNPNGIGYVGLAYINVPGVKVLPVNGYMPTDVVNYPLARPLYLLYNANSKLSRVANDFIGFSLSPEGQKIVSRVHFLPLH